MERDRMHAIHRTEKGDGLLWPYFRGNLVGKSLTTNPRPTQNPFQNIILQQATVIETGDIKKEKVKIQLFTHSEKVHFFGSKSFLYFNKQQRRKLFTKKTGITGTGNICQTGWAILHEICLVNLIEANLLEHTFNEHPFDNSNILEATKGCFRLIISILMCNILLWLSQPTTHVQQKQIHFD